MTDRKTTDQKTAPQERRQTRFQDERVNIEGTEPETRETKRQKEGKHKKKRTRKPRIRVFPIWLRIIVVLLLVAGSATLGLMFGYGIVGDGEPLDALNRSTWQHILDIIQGVE